MEATFVSSNKKKKRKKITSNDGEREQTCVHTHGWEESVRHTRRDTESVQFFDHSSLLA